MNTMKIQNPTAEMRFPKLGDTQRGATLLVTLMVLLALTVIAIAATNSNQSQSIMVRNNQFRFEAFNTSYAEVDGQIDFVNNRAIAQGVPDHIITLIDGNVGGTVSNTQAGVRELGFQSTNKTTYMTRNVSQRYNGRCLVFGQQIGVGNEKVRCNELEINSNANLNNTSVGSNQFQVYEYKTLN